MRPARSRFLSIPYLAWRVRRAARRARLGDRLIQSIVAALEAKTRIPAWVMIPILGLVGLSAAAAYSWTIPDTFVSTSIIGITDGYLVGVDPEDGARLGIPSEWWFTTGEGNARRYQILAREPLAKLIHDEGLYKEELTRMPLEDLISQMKKSDIRIEPVAGTRRSFALSFAAPSAALAQGVAWNLATMFADGNAFSVLESASLPVHPESPQRLEITLTGLAGGLLAGALAALFTALKVWKLALALGIAGATPAFFLPAQYASTELVRYYGEWSEMRESISAVTSDASLRAIILNSGADMDLEEGSLNELRDHLRIQPTLEPDAEAVVISFVHSSPLIAQKVVQNVASSLMDDLSQRDSGVTLGVMDPANVPVDPSSPDRPFGAAAGCLVGLACAMALGFWRYWKGSYPWDGSRVRHGVALEAAPLRN